MNSIDTELPGVRILEPVVHTDDRGSFTEVFTPALVDRLQMGCPFVQCNESVSRRLVLRGMHWQDPPQSKLVRVVEGEILDAVADVSPDSAFFRQSVLVYLTASSGRMLFVPRGYAHGFIVLSRHARMQYFCDTVYAPQRQLGVRWDDPQLSISWKTTRPVVSPKDAALPFLDDILPADLLRA